MTFPPRVPGRLYLTEGGIETEILYKWGHELPQFAMFTLLDDPVALEDMKGIWRRYLTVADRHELVPLIQGTDYRASPDWGELLGYSREGLAEMIHKNIAFLRELEAEFDFQESYVGGTIGPRGDAYGSGDEITAEAAEEYHSFQLQSLKDAGADHAWAMTFNNVPESVGVARAAKAIGLPLAITMNVTSAGELRSGVPLRDAIAQIDAAAGEEIAFLGINCAHPLEFQPALVPGAWQERIRSIRPNASQTEKLALCKIGHLEDGDPEELGRQMADIVRRMPQIDILGGCCGTDERHLERMAIEVKAMRNMEPA
ncbi:MAG: homocysteine S-methyltransferase family protein [Silicimonas sp.]|nr:homocysteine S-methyltransferase family protein [Silicimonas sp.]